MELQPQPDAHVNCDRLWNCSQHGDSESNPTLHWGRRGTPGSPPTGTTTRCFLGCIIKCALGRSEAQQRVGAELASGGGDLKMAMETAELQDPVCGSGGGVL